VKICFDCAATDAKNLQDWHHGAQNLFGWCFPLAASFFGGAVTLAASFSTVLLPEQHPFQTLSDKNKNYRCPPLSPKSYFIKMFKSWCINPN